MSEGNFLEMNPHIDNKKSKDDVDESSDMYDTVDWLLKNIPNNNGKSRHLGHFVPGVLYFSQHQSTRILRLKRLRLKRR